MGNIDGGIVTLVKGKINREHFCTHGTLKNASYLTQQVLIKTALIIAEVVRLWKLLKFNFASSDLSIIFKLVISLIKACSFSINEGAFYFL